MGDNARSYSAIFELVGILGVIGSLVFVGFEVHQNTIATKAANDLAVSDAFREVNLALATNPELAHALVEASRGAVEEDMTPEDVTQAKAWWRALFHTWSNAYRQHLNGTLDPALWVSVAQEIDAYSGSKQAVALTGDIALRGRIARWAWQSERYIYSPDFRSYVDKEFNLEQQE